MPADDIQVKLYKQVVMQGRQVSDAKGIPLGRYFSEILGPIVARDFEEEMRKLGYVPLAQAAPPPEKPRKKGGE